MTPVPIPVSALASEVAAQLSGTQLLGVGLSGGMVTPANVNGAAAGTLGAWRAEAVSVRQFGAHGDGQADDTAAFLLGFAWLAAEQGRVLYLPAGVYNLMSLSQSLAMPSGATVKGAGMHRSQIIWNDTAGINLFTTTQTVTDIAFEDFTVTGSCATNWVASTGGYPFLLNNATGVALRRVCSEWSRAMGIALRHCADVMIEQPLVRYTALDGISVSACEQVLVTGAVVEWTDDDAISWHADTSETTPHGTLVICGFRIRFTGGGINALGAKLCVIDGGILELVRFQGISVGGSFGATEGYTSLYGVCISNIVIRDMLDASLAGDGASGCRALCVNSTTAQAGGLSGIPGLTVPLAAHVDGNSTQTSVPIAIGSGIAIANVQVLSGRGAVANYSAFGFGQMFTRHGWIDPAVPQSALQPTALCCLNGIIRDLKLAHCLFEGNGAADAIVLSTGVRLLASEITGCTFRDYASVFFVGNGLPQDLVIRGGVVDLDPYQNAPGRNSGGWASAGPVLLQTSGSIGIVLDGVALRNLYDPTAGSALFRNCILRCDPVSGNKGIGVLPAGGNGFFLIHEDCNPASATFGDVLFSPSLDANSQPAAGVWLAGQFVRNNAITVSGGKMLLGWMRLTTGSGNVAAVDWVTVYVSTS